MTAQFASSGEVGRLLIFRGGDQMKFRLIAFVIAGMLGSGLTSYAHHSFTSLYDEASSIEIEGQLVQFLLRNPHSWIHVLAPDENGEMVRWGVEWDGAGPLGSQGLTRGSLRPGDHVIISGNPGLNLTNHKIMRMRTILRPSDGFGWGDPNGDIGDDKYHMERHLRPSNGRGSKQQGEHGHQ